ncbi:glycoside hydrolase family 16 protein [Rhodococcus triatomae]|nr:glycoside hydrolase family 16 protein [Rhodococcus triatomae]QNG25525.1 glycoside hydrolase family 16 protein [Rhodococcus triatomae]
MPPYANPCAAEEPPSGVAVPAGNLPGWRQIFVDEFDRCELGGTWSTYSGNPGGNPHSLWDGSMVETGDGTLALRARRDEAGDWITGGVSNYPVTQLYGRWEIRMRADHSDDISYHMLLWPQNEQWPPEIDFAESVSGDRSEMDAFLHWVGADGENDKASAAVNGDFSDWHTVGVEWLPGLVRYLLDGRVWAEVRSAHMVPTVPMWLGMQAEAGACERRLDWGLTPCDEDPQDRPDTATVEIDWVTVYAPDEAEIERMTRNGEFDRTESAVRITDD